MKLSINNIPSCEKTIASDLRQPAQCADRNGSRWGRPRRRLLQKRCRFVSATHGGGNNHRHRQEAPIHHPHTTNTPTTNSKTTFAPRKFTSRAAARCHSVRARRRNPREAPCEVPHSIQVRMQVLECPNLRSPIRQEAIPGLSHGPGPNTLCPPPPHRILLRPMARVASHRLLPSLRTQQLERHFLAAQAALCRRKIFPFLGWVLPWHALSRH